MSTMIDPTLPREGVATTRHQPLMLLLCASALGVVLDRYLTIAELVWWWLTITAFLIWLLLQRWRPGITTIALLIAFAGAFAAWHHAWWYRYPATEIGRSASFTIQPVMLEGIALTHVRLLPAPAKDPLSTIPRGDRCLLDVQITSARHGTQWQPATGQAPLVVDGHLLGVRSGDRLRMGVLMQRIPPAQNPGEFDAAEHYRVKRQLVRLHAPTPDCITILSKGSDWNWRRWLERLRLGLDRQLHEHLSPQRAGLAAGLLLGSREQIDYEQTQEFFLTGTIHLLAISGVHVGILAYGFWMVMRTGLLSRRASIIAAMLFVLVYTIIADAQPPVLRSAILVMVICWGRWLGRPVPPLNALAAGGLVVLAMNPAQLFQVGTQLSFLAVGTLIYCGPLVRPGLPEDPLECFLQTHEPWLWRTGRVSLSFLWRLWLTGASVWLVALPLTLYRFHVMSPAALWLNPLVWFPISIALYAGFATLTLGWLVPPLGTVCGAICDFSLWLVEDSIHYGERSFGSYDWLPGPALWWVIGFYLGLAVYVGSPDWRRKKLTMVTLLVGWVMVGYACSVRSPLWSFTSSQPDMTTTFVSVGHGTSVLCEFKNGRTLLYDAGHMGAPNMAANSISAVLWSRGIQKLDMVVLSHADADHYNALPELLKRFEVEVVYTSSMMFDEMSPGVQALYDAIEKHAVPIKIVHLGQRLDLGEGVRAEVLHPPARDFVGSDNASSIVLVLTSQNQRVLLPGDLETTGLLDVFKTDLSPCSVVMAPHHGSVRSNPRGFAAWSKPAWVVISGSRSRDASEVVDAYRSAGADVLQTAHDGAIRFVMNEGTTRAETWEADHWLERRHHAAP